MVVAVYLESEVPVFTPTEEQVARFRARLRDPSAPGPSDRWEVLHCRSEREFLDALPRAAAVAVWRFRQEWFALAPRLRAVCTPAAGRDYFRVVPPPGVEMRYGGFHGAIMGETAAACVLALSHGVLRHAGAAVINSGTASLEAALVGTPQVVGWNSSALTVFLMRHIGHVMDHIKYISLGNLILDRLAFRELVQEEFTPAAVTDEVVRLLGDDAYRARMLSEYGEIRKALGTAWASRAVAAAMIAALKP